MNTLLEIGTEHLPARFVMPSLEQLKTHTEAILQENRISFESVETFGTYRRLVVMVNGIADKASDMEKEVKGPPAKLLKDANGKFTPQSAGFAQKNGISPEKLVVKETDKGPFIYADIKIKGEKTSKLLPEIFTRIVTELEFAKNMVWEESQLKYGRPIRSLLGLYGDKVVKFTVAGVTSSRYTYPMISFGRKPIKISRADKQEYVQVLRNQYPPILVLPQERRNALIKTVSNEAQARGYLADLDESLITETVCFTEHPVAVGGDFELKFLTLPKELITTVLKKQIKMFPVVDKKGELQPYFIAVRDGLSVNQTEVSDGFKKVMSARLSDAVFFFENDKKEGLKVFKEKLKNIQFLEGLGSLFDKSTRVQQLALWLTDKLGKNNLKQTVEYAAGYAYADLASHVVYEFPELQGYMGGQYAALEGKKEAAQAMEEFYFPLTSTSALPSTEAGNIVSLAGKIDTLVGNFIIGQIPTGSEDPFALRRQAFAVVRILLENKMPISIREILTYAARLYKTGNQDKGLRELPEFLFQRLSLVLEQRGHQSAVLGAVKNWEEIPFAQVEEAVGALEQVKTNPKFDAVLEAAKRVCNILKKATVKETPVQASLLELPAEQNLFSVLESTAKRVTLQPHTQKQYLETLSGLTVLKDPLEKFFTDVMVNVENEDVRNNRLALLNKAKYLLTETVADITRL
ncbi:MAG: glycine--tRNA ligase subunit beta [Elusimicrobiaceae bacterium]|nr:glycine--tRNA ligase subunit beta [Elusimicrobiaceae bacterium]